MDIKSSSGTSGIDRTVDARRSTSEGQGKQAKAQVEATESADQLTLTSAMQRLLQASRDAADGAPVDSARVETIKAAIGDGSYVVDSGRIANAPIRSESGLSD